MTNPTFKYSVLVISIVLYSFTSCKKKTKCENEIIEEQLIEQGIIYSYKLQTVYKNQNGEFQTIYCSDRDFTSKRDKVCFDCSIGPNECYSEEKRSFSNGSHDIITATVYRSTEIIVDDPETQQGIGQLQFFPNVRYYIDENYTQTQWTNENFVFYDLTKRCRYQEILVDCLYYIIGSNEETPHDVLLEFAEIGEMNDTLIWKLDHIKEL